MPELPEVETVKNILLPLIKNKTIVKVNIFYDPLIKSNLDEFKKNIINLEILDLKRYGKYLFFILSDDYILITHLRMEGKFFFNKEKKGARKKETTLIFTFKDETYLSFNDTRKFGLMYLTKKDEIENLPMINKLGVEANKVQDKDIPLLIRKFKKNKAIKDLLLDQTILCGIGNIYADETLFRSQIHPLTKGKDLNEEQILSLINNAKLVLDKAILLGGSSVHSFNASGIDGKFQNELLAYGKKGTLCPNCSTPFHKIFVSGRGTTFCPNCQIYHSLKKAIAITGNIASGKSTLLNHLTTLNYLTYSCDEMIKELYNEPYILKKVSKILNYNFVPNNKESRNKVKEIFNNEPNKKEQIENFLYPILEEKMINLIKNNEDETLIFEVPTLFKAHFEYMFKKIIVLLNPIDLQKRNLKLRGETNIDESLKLNDDFYYDKNNKDIFLIIPNGDINYLFEEALKIIYS